VTGLTRDLLDRVSRAGVRRDLVEPYAEAIRVCVRGGGLTSDVMLVDWPAVNHAIAARWSWAAVAWVKKAAWRLVEEC